MSMNSFSSVVSGLLLGAVGKVGSDGKVGNDGADIDGAVVNNGAGNGVGCDAGMAVGEKMFGEGFGQSQSSRTNGRTMAVIAHTAMNRSNTTMQRKRA